MRTAALYANDAENVRAVTPPRARRSISASAALPQRTQIRIELRRPKAHAAFVRRQCEFAEVEPPGGVVEVDSDEIPFPAQDLRIVVYITYIELLPSRRIHQL